MPEIRDWENGFLIQAPISMAPPLRQVNSYILRGEEGITIIDPGPRTETTEQEWADIWRQLHIRPQQVKQIVLTHHHPDHYGLAGYLQNLTGAKVLMSERSHREARLMWDEGRAMNAELPPLFLHHGLPRKIAGQLPPHLESFFPQVNPAPEVTYIDESDRLVMGGRSWQPVETGGHASGHLSFYLREEGIMLCGDAVLPQISPNISLYPGGDPQPLQTFLDGLQKLSGYEVKMAYPGHRRPFDYFRSRTEALIAHHEERLAKVLGLLRQGPKNAYEICLALFGNTLGIHQMRFAMSESLAHLIELVRRGQVRMETDEEGSDRFVMAEFSARR
ncbi:MBL fold metallo-hydrolase [Paenibacillus caui]|uniref:MBL fold metallo-hydrolase n=1 Tax=Paenibacillus caui TaxID=2873927 RepID=UPI001CA922B1|nr:MBL fold metallo-hydrolase [Paenibacillus caui]